MSSAFKLAKETLKMRKKIVTFGLAAGLLLGLGACSNPYSPGQRAVGGGLLGAGAGAGVAGLTGGDVGTGALIGGAIGAVGGAVTTPDRPRYGGGYGGGYGRNGGYPRRGYY
jgi:hypothetical protein